MTVRVPVESALLAWAQRRSGVSRDSLVARFPALDAWEAGEKQPTLRQLEQFARATYTPVGFLLLTEPPAEQLPVPDFRTIGDVEVGQASPDLLDTIYQCQQRQDWYRDYARSHRELPVAFVGTLTTAVAVKEAAPRMREVLAFEPDERGANWSEAARRLIEDADRHGVLVMVNGGREQHPPQARPAGVPRLCALGRTCAADLRKRRRHESCADFHACS